MEYLFEQDLEDLFDLVSRPRRRLKGMLDTAIAVFLAQCLGFLQGDFLLLRFLAVDQVFLVADEYDAEALGCALGTHFFDEIFGALERFPICHIVDYKAAFRTSIVTLNYSRKLSQSGRIPQLSLHNLLIVHNLLFHAKFHPNSRIVNLRGPLPYILLQQASLANSSLAHNNHFKNSLRRHFILSLNN